MLAADHPRIPDPLAQAIASLQRQAGACWLVGEGLACAWWAEAGERTPSWLAVCEAPAARLLELDPRAVATGVRANLVTIPTPGGPLDVRCDWTSGREGLAEFGFRVHAIAYDPVGREWIDPFGARADVEAARLSCVGDAAAVLASEPTASLRALRLVSENGLTPDAELEAALREFVPAFTLASRRHGRSELARILLGANAGGALELAERTGFASRLAPTRSGASAWIDALPRDLEVRLAGWLGHDAANWLRSWRFGVERSERILDWIAHHPVEQCIDPRRDGAVGRLERRFEAAGLDAMFALREAELASGRVPDDEVARARKALSALERAIDRVRANRERAAKRKTLALDGEAVMQQLGCGPGRKVGLALRHLTAWVAEDEARNRPETLRAELEAWARKSSD